MPAKFFGWIATMKNRAGSTSREQKQNSRVWIESRVIATQPK